MIYTMYLNQTGEIVATLECSTLGEAMLHNNHEFSVCEGEYQNVDSYVKNGTPLARPSMPIPLRLSMSPGESLILDGIPRGAEVELDGKTEVIAGTILTLEGDVEATYSITFKCFPYLPHTLEVVVCEA